MDNALGFTLLVVMIGLPVGLAYALAGTLVTVAVAVWMCSLALVLSVLMRVVGGDDGD